MHGGPVLPSSSGETTPDWSQLQQDVLVGILSRLDLPDLVCSVAVCSPWRLSYLAVRRFGLCSPAQSPYLVYSSGDRDGSTATLHSLATDRRYHLPLPDPPFRRRYVVGSSRGWLAAADERSNLHLLNPVTGAQLLAGHSVTHLDVRPPGVGGSGGADFYPPDKTRFFLYQKVVLSSSDPAGGDCTVVIKHRPWDPLSFARVGDDDRWTWIHNMKRCDRYDDVFYDDHDRLFYAVRNTGEVHAVDLNGPAPMLKVILNLNTEIGVGCDFHYLLRAPWGDLLQIRRLYSAPPQVQGLLDQFGLLQNLDQDRDGPA
ncbi:hypothetical protein ACP4OV_031414 [Aristida adscensionis]